MNCHQAQSAFSLYLYGELDFAREEDLEDHLAQCAFCQLGLAREKEWHGAANAQVQEPPFDLLAECRQQLRSALAREKAGPSSALASLLVRWRPGWLRLFNPFQISATRWSAQIALASMLLFAGFASARWLDRGGSHSNLDQMSLFNTDSARIRDIRPDGAGLVRIVVDQQSEITGHIDDANIRSLLIAGTRQADPGVRFYSFQVLSEQGGDHLAPKADDDLREVVFYTVRNDPNPAVRLEAIEGLRRFAGDPGTLETLKFVLEHDADAGVRSEAIDILAPVGDSGAVTPARAEAMQEVIHSSTEDEYVRARCTQVLHEAKLPVIY
jgi:hypothetical protein